MGVRCATASTTQLDDMDEASDELASTILKKVAMGARAAGVLFCSIELDLGALLAALRSRLDIPLIGCTTYSEATEDGYFEASASLLVITSDSLSVGLGLGERLSEDVDAAVTKAYGEARAALGEDPKLIITFPDAALTAKGEAVLDALARKNTGAAPVFGGCPGDGGRFKQTFQLCGDKVCSDSIPILLLGGDIHPLVITRSGWIPIGAKARATKVAGNRLLEIDDKPAIDYLKRYVGNTDDPEILGTYPIAMLDESLGADAGRYFVLRSPFSYDKETGAIDLGGQIPQGGVIQMARGTRDDVLGGASDAAGRLVEAANDQQLSCVLFASCGARKLMLGMATERELALIRGKLPSGLPIAGFYSYGEMGAIDSTDPRLAAPRFHNTTLVLCGL